MLLLKIVFWTAALYLAFGAGTLAVQTKRALGGDDASMPLADLIWTPGGLLTAISLVACILIILSVGHGI
jgi:hypothetical protein